MAGPSPQAWGTPGGLATRDDAVRAIPTGVGNSANEPYRTSAAPGHPHRRGELTARAASLFPSYGPSPQAWGTPLEQQETRIVARAIPTGVGNSAASGRCGPSAAGHPHRRGELRTMFGSKGIRTGPSPQAWGTRSHASRIPVERRAIPTGVGNSASPSPIDAPAPGHPHRRGELSEQRAVMIAQSGPSPQAWGTPDPDRPRERHGRAIPTGVGNSRAAVQAVPVVPKTSRAIPTGVGNSFGNRGRCGWGAGHPHRRGELRGRCGWGALQRGPSPQAWGTRVGAGEHGGSSRAIPTGVGNSCCGPGCGRCHPGHPHRRGELTARPARPRRACGPSPQAWGTPQGRVQMAVVAGPSPQAWGTRHRSSYRFEEAGPSPQAWGTQPPAALAAQHGRAIPTGVGNSAARSAARDPGSGHPHRRGELASGVLKGGGIDGPSPQAWGTRCRCAGGCRRWSGHPHRRGELRTNSLPACPPSGPSPQAWGTRTAFPGLPVRARAIPTGVGNSSTG